jgi:hypothetical protein
MQVTKSILNCYLGFLLGSVRQTIKTSKTTIVGVKVIHCLSVQSLVSAVQVELRSNGWSENKKKEKKKLSV